MCSTWKQRKISQSQREGSKIWITQIWFRNQIPDWRLRGQWIICGIKTSEVSYCFRVISSAQWFATRSGFSKRWLHSGVTPFILLFKTLPRLGKKMFLQKVTALWSGARSVSCWIFFWNWLSCLGNWHTIMDIIKGAILHNLDTIPPGDLLMLMVT